MLTEGRFTLRLLLAFIAVAVAFVGSSLYSNWLTLKIEGESQSQMTNALPSIDYLTKAADQLRDLEAATDDYADLPPQERAPARLDLQRRWKLIDAELTGYLKLPSFADERQQYAEIPPALRALDESVQQLFLDVESGDRERARTTADDVVRVRANGAAQSLRRLVRLNAVEAYQSSLRIQDTRRRAVTFDTLLNTLSVIMTAVIGLWMWRVFRTFSRLQARHAELVQRRADELELFARRVAHDLLSPLSSLTFCLTAFKPAAETDTKLQNALGRARQCVVRARGLVDNVFDFARSGGAPLPEARADVREVVEEVVEEALAVDPTERAEISVPELPPLAVRCTSGVLTSILGNLVRNAIKFMRDSEVRRIAIRVRDAGDHVAFEVEDTGPGVDPTVADTIFMPYVRGQGVTQPGLGLGLATVKRFCEAYGGTVGFQTTPGQGSVFRFTLPKAEEASREAPLESLKLLREAAGEG